MSDTKHVVLIHGSWSRGEQFAPARAAFEERGYTAHTPTLRHHELPSHEGAMKVASLGRVCREADSRWCMARKARQALSGAAAAHNPQRTTVRLRRSSALQPLGRARFREARKSDRGGLSETGPAPAQRP